MTDHVACRLIYSLNTRDLRLLEMNHLNILNLLLSGRVRLTCVHCHTGPKYQPEDSPLYTAFLSVTFIIHH